MKGAIFYSTKYGSTAEYANWINEATGLPLFNIKDKNADPSNFDFLVLGSPIYYYKLKFRDWIKSKWTTIKDKPIILFSVSGVGPGEKLDGWIKESLSEELISKIKHVGLFGRQLPKELTWFDRLMEIIGGLFNPDPKARKEELEGFDYMDKSSIHPIVDFVKDLQIVHVQ